MTSITLNYIFRFFFFQNESFANAFEMRKKNLFDLIKCQNFHQNWLIMKQKNKSDVNKNLPTKKNNRKWAQKKEFLRNCWMIILKHPFTHMLV